MRTNSVYLDTETCGFHGMPVLLQYAWDDGQVRLFEPWREPVYNTLKLIEQFMDKTLIGFNLAFDHFHLCKLYTTWRLLPSECIPADLPVLQVAEAELAGRDGPCLKPRGAVDLMLHSRKGEHQSLMSRHDVRVRKIPEQLAPMVCEKLEEIMSLDPILNAKWGVYDHKTHKGTISEEFKDVVLRFKPDRGLKSLAKNCLGLDPEFHSFREVWPVRGVKLAELGYAPCALLASDPENWEVRDKNQKLKGYTWPLHIHNDIEHWGTNEEARRYARDDVTYTRLLDKYFGFPGADDDDFLLACMVAAVRWHGFAVDLDQTKVLMHEADKILKTAPVNINKPTSVREYIREAMDDTEAILLDKSTKKANLEKIRDRMVVEEYDEDEEIEECFKCAGEGCVRCDGNGIMLPGPMAASRRADEILKIKAASKEKDQHAKILLAGRFHASFKVIGTLSSRMSGGDGLNAQGIKKSEKVRKAFPLAWEGMELLGGDFDSFEVTLADAVFGDARLRQDLLSGLSIHTVMAKQLYPDKSYEEILASKGYKDGGDIDMYTRGKQAVFAMLYGGDENTINKKLAIKMKVAEAAFDGFQKRYPGIRDARDANQDRFGAMAQTGGIGTKIEWHDPDDYSETFLGFRRYFTLENQICKILFDLGQAPPREWKLGARDAFNPTVFTEYTCDRRGRTQTLSGAASSAIYGAAFQLQAANTRAANNHLIQSPGAQITKRLQVAIWGHQPPGIHGWQVAPLNVHDEVMVAARPGLAPLLEVTVKETVESFRGQVPLIALMWASGLKSWGHSLPDDHPNVLHIQPEIDMDDRDDPEADLPSLEESVDEWAEREDDE